MSWGGHELLAPAPGTDSPHHTRGTLGVHSPRQARLQADQGALVWAQSRSQAPG